MIEFFQIIDNETGAVSFRYGELTHNVPDGADVEAEKAAWVAANGIDLSPPVPQRVDMRRARLALLNAGKLADVQQIIDGLTGAAGEAARIEWEYATTVTIDSQLITDLAPAVWPTLTPEERQTEIENLFRAAELIP